MQLVSTVVQLIDGNANSLALRQIEIVLFPISLQI